MLVFLLVFVVILALLGAVHWYVWRRLVRDVTARGSVARRLGTVAAFVLPVLSFAALGSARAAAPFWLQQVVAWPGYLWLAVLLYVTLALVVGEAVRPLLRRALDRRAAARALAPAPAQAPAQAPAPTPAPVPAQTAVTDPAPATPSGGGDDSERPDADRPEAERGQADRPDADRGDDSERGEVKSVAGATAVSRRLFVSRVVGGAAAAAAVGTVGYGTYGVLRGPSVKRVTVPLAKLPRAAHGYRIAVVSDIHLGPVLGRAHSQRIVDAVNGTQPDLIAIVGDLVDGSVADLGPAAEPLAQLRARHGSFFVTGNHEYFSGADAWVDHVRELGLRPLRNERLEIPAGFDLAGVDDIAGESEGQGPDFAAALGDRDRARAAVLLAHQPVVIHDAVRHGVDLQLSGHTHGGQLWPGNYLAELANPTVAGLERYGDTQLYVSRGAGAWGPPVRVGAPSDITVVELASKQA
ncbi:metallophosphoesterase [Streptomyces sp. Je 1-79]|uniref:metallophosphoesterase n=1 Tax=Streptomyces sp. Je 1-79 TaxID=2943847 RepID=UPI0021A9148F|nr:metallophosphoesterase [Streptomyces sp. Je 1-79]MCT4355675.1 metallophosphoesterase [Streptomyces sp. Je 1-79]